jgi:hypothetical protein
MQATIEAVGIGEHEKRKHNRKVLVCRSGMEFIARDGRTGEE